MAQSGGHHRGGGRRETNRHAAEYSYSRYVVIFKRIVFNCVRCIWTLRPQWKNIIIRMCLVIEWRRSAVAAEDVASPKSIGLYIYRRRRPRDSTTTAWRRRSRYAAWSRPSFAKTRKRLGTSIIIALSGAMLKTIRRQLKPFDRRPPPPCPPAALFQSASGRRPTGSRPRTTINVPRTDTPRVISLSAAAMIGRRVRSKSPDLRSAALIRNSFRLEYGHRQIVLWAGSELCRLERRFAETVSSRNVANGRID